MFVIGVEPPHGVPPPNCFFFFLVEKILFFLKKIIKIMILLALVSLKFYVLLSKEKNVLIVFEIFFNIQEVPYFKNANVIS